MFYTLILYPDRPAVGKRDLLKAFGEKYRKCREEVPMFIPHPGRKTTDNKHKKFK